MITETKTNTDTRAEYIAGLRMLADTLDANPDLELPIYGDRYAPMAVYLVGDENQRGQLAAWAKALPGRKEKADRDTRLDLKGAFRGLHISVTVEREEVCEKVVLGTREVTEEVPDPNAPTVTVTKTVEDVKWICRPILDEESDDSTELAAVAS